MRTRSPLSVLRLLGQPLAALATVFVVANLLVPGALAATIGKTGVLCSGLNSPLKADEQRETAPTCEHCCLSVAALLPYCPRHAAPQAFEAVVRSANADQLVPSAGNVPSWPRGPPSSV